MTRTDSDWATADDQRWGDAVRWRLAVSHPAATRPLIDQVLAEAQQACAESGLPAEELFGDAESYAAEVAAERISEEERATVDMDGIAPAEQLQGMLLAVGFTGGVLAVVLMLTHGWYVETSPWQVVLLVAGSVALGAAVGAVLARSAGRLRRSWSLVATTLAVLGAGTAVAVVLQDRPPLGQVPTLVPALVYGVLFVIGWAIPTPTPRPTTQDVPAEAWFTQLGELLRGRYYLTRAAAADYVTEARTVWQESATAHPQDVLGSPQVYALQLMDGSPQPHRARRRFAAWAATLVAATWVVLTPVLLWDGAETGHVLWRTAAVIFFVVVAVLAWRRHLRDRHEAGAAS
ncbi:hypothetical protein AA0Y32_17400 [Georgenia phoenicis]|uniref:hypothetical protein n=1 Tax=unclassified Georgenia TaxID=2626815 RepID=UPI0039AF5B64